MNEFEYGTCPHCDEPIADNIIVMETHANSATVSELDPHTLIVGYLDTSNGGDAKWICNSCMIDITSFIDEHYTIVRD
jgi:hypothetical protein